MHVAGNLQVRRRLVRPVKDLPEDVVEREHNGRISYTASLITQGNHRFHTLSMPSDVLAETCVVEPRDEEPERGFQRALDRKRAEDIAKYIDIGFGTIPTSIVLSAQPEAELEYSRRTRTLSFNKIPRAFLILDGQHRVYGFRLANSRLRVPVVIYNNLSRAEECRLFMDINTKQRPVPNELLLDISRLADTETDLEALFHDVFDRFNSDQKSPLFGLMSPSARRKGKISRVTFNAALKAIGDAFTDSDAEDVYRALSSYMHSCLAGLRLHNAEANITNPTLFRALVLLFPIIAERVADRHGSDFSVAHFDEIVGPFFQRVKKAELQKPGQSHQRLHESFRKTLRTGFTLGSV
jgi:DGQHR domain-containing protein